MIRVRPSLEDFTHFQRAGFLLGMKDDGKPGSRLQAMTIPAMAAELGIAKSTLFAAIKHIDRGLRGPRDKESTAGVFRVIDAEGTRKLSATGIRYFERVTALLKLHREVTTCEDDRPTPLAIGAYNSLLASYLPKALGPLVTKPKFSARVALRLHDYTLTEILEAVAGGEIEFGVGSVPIGAEKRLVRGRAEVVAFPFDIQRVFICHRYHHLAKADEVKPSDLAGEVLFRLPAVVSTPGLTTWIPADSLAGGRMVEATTFSVILQWVRLGFGVSVLAYLPGEIADAVKSGELHCRPLPAPSVATVAAFLPLGGEAVLSEAAHEAYVAVRDYFTRTKPLKAPPHKAGA